MGICAHSNFTRGLIMIKHLSGEYETVEYENKRLFLLHDNYDNEAYPIHWHNAVEILMPLENSYIVN